MKQIEGFLGKSQYDDDINERFRPSACGPVTAYTILRHHAADTISVDELYRLLGGTRIGLFTWRFAGGMRKLLGHGWTVEKCGIDELKQEIDEGRPVAAKFDKWFTLRWGGKFSFDYHWVPVIGYKQSPSGPVLLIHDNGGRQRKSRVREIPYEPNRPILTFIRIVKTTVD